ncbi:hypothetical protein KAI46_11135, partial [bacterium]|nr:hypothetical protein [bacterium]
MKKYIIFLSLLLLLLFVNTVFPQTGTDPSNIPPGVSGIIAAHKISQSPSSPDITRRQQQWQFHNPKLGNLLNQKLNEAMSTDDRTLKTDNGLNRLKPNSPEETICVQIKCAPNPHESASGIARERVKEAIEKSNGRITGSSLNQMTIQALLPLTAVNSLTDLPEIDFILIPNRAVTFTENYTTEALDDINVNNWHDAGIYGQNTRIGVIDVGFIGYNALKGSDLPATVMVKNFVDGENDALIESNSVHGTACAEIIYDIAPDAGLYLAKIYTDIDLQEAVTWLQANNVDIISTSLGWYNLTPGDGTGGLADIVTQAYNSGMLWVTAAGNDQQRHWGGLFSDPDGNHMHNFTSDQQINFFGPGDGSAYLINPGLNYTIFARWSDWTDVDQDYDLYVYRWNGNDWGSPIASSVNSQYGISGQVPTEAVAFTTSGDPTAYGFIIYHSFEVNKEVNFEIYAPYAPRFDEILNIRSLANLADATKATTVSAIDVSSYILQDYSSMGPT